MDVVVGILRRVDLDNEMNMIEINSSGDDVGGKQAATRFVEECFDKLLSSLCLEFSMETNDFLLFFKVKEGVEEFGIKVDWGACVEEHDDFGLRDVVSEEVGQELHFLNSTRHD